jgi:Transglutaminase-like superfamily
MTGPHSRRRPSLVLLLRIYLVAVAVPLLLRLRLSRVSLLFEPRRPGPDTDPERERELIRAVDWVMRSGWPLVRPGCLTRGFTLLYFLRRAGANIELLFGVGELDGRTEAHCWLVRDGEPYLESTDPRLQFTPVCRLTRGAAVPVG